MVMGARLSKTRSAIEKRLSASSFGKRSQRVLPITSSGGKLVAHALGELAVYVEVLPLAVEAKDRVTGVIQKDAVMFFPLLHLLQFCDEFGFGEILH